MVERDIQITINIALVSGLSAVHANQPDFLILYGNKQSLTRV
jgi:hypothetical protein